MTVLAQTDELFFTRAGLDRSRIERLVGEALSSTGIQPVGESRLR